MNQLIQNIGLEQHKPITPTPQIGDRVNVHVRVFEGGKERIQAFQGVVIKMKGKGISRAFTVRKISDNIGVERTFPLCSPILSKIEVLSKAKVRRAKLYYIRKLKGRASRLTAAFFSDKEKQNKDAETKKEPDTSSTTPTNN